jgi:hypothetical protein
MSDSAVYSVDTDGMFAAVGDLRGALRPAAESPQLVVPDLLNGAATSAVASLVSLAGAVPAAIASQLEVIADTTAAVTVRAMLADCNTDWRVDE